MERPWIQYYDPGVAAHIAYPALTLPELFDRVARDHPERVATIFHGAKLRYRELRDQIDAFATGLRASGLHEGDRLALMLPNVPQFLVAFFGALKAGLVVVPTNPLYTQHELEHQLTDAGATAIVTLDQLFGRVQAALPNTRVRMVIVAGIRQALPRRLQPLYTLKQWREGVHAVKRGGVVHRFGDLLAANGSKAFPPGDPEGVAVLQYTGGTTGQAKGAMLTHANLIANTLQAKEWQGGDQDQEVRVLCAAPFFHVYGLTIGMNLSVALGATMLLAPRWNAREVADMAKKYKPQLFPGVPTMYVALSNLPDFSQRQFGSLQVCLSGAAPLPPEVQRRFQEVSTVKLVEGYGLTEASPVTHCNPLSSDHGAGTIGIPFPDTDAMITDPDSWEPLPPGAVGELTVRGPQVMQGYWQRPEETANVLRDGWLHTGDLATVDGEGFFRVVDRKKDLIISGGYNIYPRQVEDVLYGCRKISEASVIGVPHEYRGETVKAVIVLREGASATAEEIMVHCRQELAPYKVPKIIEFRDELPKTLIGKVLRRALREEPVAFPVPVIDITPAPGDQEQPVA